MSRFIVPFVISLLWNGASATPISVDPAESNLLIVGGSEATPHEFPWLASLHWQEGQFCSGVIVSPTAVLTTASCASLITSWYLDIYAGLHRLSENTTVGVQKRNPTIIQPHPSYPSGTTGRGSDIAILKIANTAPFIFDEYVSAIGLPAVGETFPNGTLGVIAGWGSAAEETVTLQDVLSKSEVQILSDEQCLAAYEVGSPGEFTGESMLCAGGGNRDFCNGDVGTPLVVWDDAGAPKVVGLAAWGQGCGNPFFPGVYTEISAYLDFINANL
ncbi:fibrinolytic enzyme, isozyme C [Folsomia candida]|uniref:fibrinolytic enzyme, isozyme C n=1 Tax=Folsomia candida TaxID=158441 RepID=UPI000B901150|nr:fibrinolytic enzyme, isozyme C [Folsomia candida]